MPVTINHVLSATTPDNTSYEIRPSHWNSQHAVTLNLSGTDVIGAFSNANGVSFGTNGASYITASFSAGGGASTEAIYIAGNTTGQSSQSTYTVGSFNISASGVISAGWSSNTLIISAPGTTNFANLSVSAGTASASLGSLVFSNSNGLSFGLSGSTITASGGGAGAAAGMSTFGNTVGTTGTFSSGTVVLVGTGPVSLSQSTNTNGATISFNAPATSGLSATGLVSLSFNGSTISIGVAGTTRSIWAPIYAGSQIAFQIGNGSVQVAPLNLDVNISASRADILASISGSTIAASTYAGTISAFLGLYTRNGSTLSLASSGSQSYSWSNSSNNNTTAFTGLRNMSVPINVNAGPQDLWVALMTQTASANTNAWTGSNMMYGGNTVGLAGLVGSSANATQQSILGLGVFSVSSAAIPASMAFSGINGTGSGAMLAPVIAFHNVSA